jgi:hypothetical protein
MADLTHPNFLMRGWAALRKRYSELGAAHNPKRATKPPTNLETAQYTELAAWMKVDDSELDDRHDRWRAAYDKTYASAYDAYRFDGKRKADARRKANRRALEAVLEAFPEEVTTIRGVEKAMTAFTKSGHLNGEDS